MEKLGFWYNNIYWFAKDDNLILGLATLGSNWKTWSDPWGKQKNRLQTLIDLGYPSYLSQQYDSFCYASICVLLQSFENL